MSFIKPEEVVKNFNLEPGMVVADFGAGSGHYTVATARLVGDNGKVYAIDIQKELLEAIKSLAEFNGLKNVEIVWSDLEAKDGSRLADESVNLVVISNILFQTDSRSAIVEEAFRIIKKGGKAAVVEWEEDGAGFGPAPRTRLNKHDCISLFAKVGFELEKDFIVNKTHYGLLFFKTL